MKTIISFIGCMLLSCNIYCAPSQAPDKTEAIDIVWDVLNVLYDAGRIVYGHATNNPVVLSQAYTDLGFDVAAAFVPGLPAGGSKLLSKTYARKSAEHILKRHASTSVERGGKFLISSIDELGELTAKAYNRIKDGHFVRQFRASDGFSVRYVVDMGEHIGYKEFKRGKVKGSTDKLYIVINPKGDASMFPAGNFNESGGFSAISSILNK